MKNIVKNSCILLLTIGLFSSCVNDTFDSPKPDVCINPGLVKTKEVADIYPLGINPSGNPANSPTYTDDDIIEGYVISSDEGGNFYQSMYIQPTDGSKGFNLSAEVKNIYNKIPPGSKVFLKLKGLGFANPTSFGIGLIFGAPPTDKYAVDRLGALKVKDYLIPSCDIVSEDDIVKKNLTIKELTTGTTYLNTLVEIDNAQFNDATAGVTYDIDRNDTSDSSTYITDGTKELAVRTSRYANFAGFKTPTGSGKIRGVLTKYGTGFQIILRTERDVNMPNPAIRPVLNEDFSNGLANWTSYSVVGPQVWAQTTFGNPAPAALMSGYSSGNKANEDWLISSELDLSSYKSASLSFDTAAKYGGDLLKIYLSRDYTGSGNPTASTWTEFTGKLSSVTGNFVWTNSGNIDISSFTGVGNNKVYVGFKYTSTTSAAASWELDNIKITVK